jgi:uncharacterized SAM-binding protein YcdF (DUF218 family)
MRHYHDTQLILAEKIFNFLYLKDDLEQAEMVVGFGHFDLKIPRTCGQLYIEGYANKIVFTGGIGAGTADLNEREALVFEKELKKIYPQIPTDDLLIEEQSTHTGENINFSNLLITERWPELAFDKFEGKVIITANAYRQRRVYLTMKKVYPHINVINYPPETGFYEELRLFESKGQDMVALLLEELWRFKDYPPKGLMLKDTIPKEIKDAYRALRAF